MSSYRSVLPIALVALVAFSTTSPAVAESTKPNFLVILVDDLGYNGVGCYGSTYHETPCIDRLAAQSVRFTDGYAGHPVCSPTRASLMTGNNPARKEVNITQWIGGGSRAPYNHQLPLEQVTIAEALRPLGYRSYHVGKWHLSHDAQEHWPDRQGFDVNIAGCGWGAPKKSYYAPWGMPNLPEKPDGAYLTDELTDQSIRLLKTHNQKYADQPFFFYLPFYTVHTPINACKRFLPHFEQKRATLIADGMIEEKTPTRPEGNGTTRMQQDNPAYASMVACLDESVGKLLKALEELGYAENTTVFFLSDNGGLSTLSGGRSMAPTCVLPLRAGKGWCYEGGVRIPYIVKIPGVTKPGTTLTQPVWTCDVYPTIMAIAGADTPAGQGRDGVNLLPLLKSGEDAEQLKLARPAPLVWYYPHNHGSAWPGGYAIREGNWKLVVKFEGAEDVVELYDLSKDLGEKNDLAGSEPAVVKELREKLETYLDDIGASRPQR